MKKLYYRGNPYAVMEDDQAAAIVKQIEKKVGHIYLNGAYLKSVYIEIMDDPTLLVEDKDRMRDDKRYVNNAEWRTYWRRQVSLSPEAKAEVNCGYFESWWYVHTGKREVPPEKWEEAKQRSIFFFREHPNRTLTKPDVWKSLFPHPTEPQHFKGVTRLEELLQQHMLKRLQVAFSEDVRMSMREYSPF